jgi:hypothetical protein
MDGFIAELKKIPPVTRFLCISSLSVTLPVMLQLLSPYKVLYVRQLVTQRYEVRLLLFVRSLQFLTVYNSYGEYRRVSCLEVCSIRFSTQK